jgi:hypothetical protein
VLLVAVAGDGAAVVNYDSFHLLSFLLACDLPDESHQLRAGLSLGFAEIFVVNVVPAFLKRFERVAKAAVRHVHH